MNTLTAVRDRILLLCEERGISINKLATISALPPSSIKNILYGITLGEFCSTPEFDALEQEIQ